MHSFPLQSPFPYSGFWREEAVFNNISKFVGKKIKKKKKSLSTTTFLQKRHILIDGNYSLQNGRNK